MHISWIDNFVLRFKHCLSTHNLVCIFFDSYADIARFGQVLSNLMGNSIPYGQEDRPITVTIAGTQRYIRLSVHNMGQPIAPTTLSTIFDSLVRGNNNDRDSFDESANMGLGLYIVKSIVKGHDGEMSVTLTADKGTTFIADFPR